MIFFLLVSTAILAVTLWYGLWWFPRHNVLHMRSVTPRCPNCGREIRATYLNNPDPRARLRDHFKECES